MPQLITAVTARYDISPFSRDEQVPINSDNPRGAFVGFQFPHMEENINIDDAGITFILDKDDRVVPCPWIHFRLHHCRKDKVKVNKIKEDGTYIFIDLREDNTQPTKRRR